MPVTSIFTYVNDTDVSSFMNNINDYESKVVFLGSSYQIATKNKIYGNKQGDWNTTNPDDPSYIKNKPTVVSEETDPTVPTYVKAITASNISFWDNKQDAILDINTIRENAEAGANKVSNVQGDWNVTDSTSQSYIKNKPVIVSAETDPTVPAHVKTITTSDISNWNSKVSNIQPDWNATTGGGSILNKPTDLSDFNDDSTHRLVTDSEKATWDGKQDAISDLATIRSNAEAGAAKVSNVQADWNASTGLAVVLNKPTKISDFAADETHRVVTDTQITAWNNKQDAISDLSTIRTNAQLATTALQSFTEADPTVPSHVKNITQNDISAWNSVSTKENPANKVTSITSSSTDTEYPSAKAVQTKFEALDGSANIASVSNGVVTIKSGVAETDGVISNSTGTDITLHKIATTGSPSDITVEYDSQSVSLQAALTSIKTGIDNAASAGTQYIVASGASSTPNSTQFYNRTNGTTTQGTLTPRNGSSGAVYLVPNGPDSFEQIVRTGNSNQTYAWTSLGSTSVDLTGLVKIISVNGRQYAVSEGTTLIDLGSIVTGVSGQTSINNGNTSVVHVVATNTTNASTGENSVTLEAQTQIGNVSSGTNGLATASDVKNYVDNKIIIRTWTSSNN